MYAVMKSLIPQDEWMEYVKTLSDKKDTVRLLYIYAHYCPLKMDGVKN